MRNQSLNPTMLNVFRTAVEEKAYVEAEEVANRRIGFFRHFVVWGASCVFFLCVSGFKTALIIGLGWGIGLAAQAYGTIIAPALRRKWVDEEVAQRVGTTVSN